MSKSELKKFMSSRPPTSDTTTTTPAQKPAGPTTQEEDAPSLLANDLALQRLLSESALLSKAMPNPMFYPTTSSSSSPSGQPFDPAGRPFAAGKLRLAQTDLRLRALGSKESLFTQKKMPMGMRRGINAAVKGREEKRRREAKENGIVLEREVKKEDDSKRRGRGGGPRGERGDVDAPAVGRMRGAQLTLSKRDIADIQGSGGGRSGGGGRGHGSRGRGGRGGGGGGGRGGKRRR
jgi:hypothetical protein